MRLLHSLFTLCILFVLAPTFFYGQENKAPYFPQEQIVIPKCQQSKDIAKCFYDETENVIRVFISENKKQLKLPNDTLKLSIRFKTYGQSTANYIEQHLTKNSKFLKRKGLKNLNASFADFKNLPIRNQKSQKYIVEHSLDFEYLLSNGEITEKVSSDPYLGGVITTAPRFPSCNEKTEKDYRKCFNMNMQNHIRQHFHYPEEAIRSQLSGKVSVIFTIDKNGDITNIRTKGPHTVLEKEAKRIIEQLPRLIPGKANEENVKYPFAIPITFKF